MKKKRSLMNYFHIHMIELWTSSTPRKKSPVANNTQMQLIQAVIVCFRSKSKYLSIDTPNFLRLFTQRAMRSSIFLGSEHFDTCSDPGLIVFCCFFSVDFVLKIIGCLVRLVCRSPILRPEVMPRIIQGLAGVSIHVNNFAKPRCVKDGEQSVSLICLNAGKYFSHFLAVAVTHSLAKKSWA